MKKTIIIGAIIFIIGAILAFIGLSNGASTSLVWQNGLKIDRRINQTKQVSKFNSIHLDTNNYEVKIKSGTNYSVEVKGSKMDKPKVVVSHKALTIESAENESGTFGFNDHDNEIIITVPNGTKLDDVTGSTNYYELEINNITANNINLDTDSSLDANNLIVTGGGHITSTNGEIDLENSNLTNVNIKQTNGSVSAENSTFTSGRIENENGSLELDDVTFNQTVTLSNDNGKIEIENPITEGYQLTSTNGSIHLFGNHQSSNLNQNENATNKIVATTTNGKIEISN